MVNSVESLSFRKISDELLVFALFFVPFVNFSPVACGVIVLCSLLSLIWGSRRFSKWNNLTAMSVAVLAYMAYASLTSLLLHADTHPFTRLQFQIRLPLLLFALAFFIRGGVGLPLRRMMKMYACGSYAMALLVFLVFAYSLVVDFDNVPRTFANIRVCFLCVVNMIVHRTYLCFDILTALLIFYFLYSEAWNKYRLFFFLCLFGITGFFVFLTDARISFLSFLFLSFCLFFVEVRRYIPGWRGWVILVTIFTVLSVLLLCSERVNNIIISMNDASFSLLESDPRFSIWSCGLELFKQCPHPLWGYGCGMARDLLHGVYTERGYTSAIESHWEMHNQFLEVLVENGIVGLLMFLGMLLLPMLMRTPLQRFYCIWIPMLCINLFFESMLSRSIGTYPIAAVLLMSGLPDEKEDHTPHVGWKWFCVVSSLIAVLCLSVKYMQKDKRNVYASFQRYFERVDDLPGNSPEDLAGTYGLKIDNHTASEKWHEWATMFHCFDRQMVNVSDSISFSIYMYASDDFDAEILQIRLEERQCKAYVASYDMSRKGEWQKLSINQKGLYGNVIYTVSCAKKDVNSFSCMHGFAIFAQPIIKVTQEK